MAVDPLKLQKRVAKILAMDDISDLKIIQSAVNLRIEQIAAEMRNNLGIGDIVCIEKDGQPRYMIVTKISSKYVRATEPRNALAIRGARWKVYPASIVVIEKGVGSESHAMMRFEQLFNEGKLPGFIKATIIDTSNDQSDGWDGCDGDEPDD